SPRSSPCATSCVERPYRCTRDLRAAARRHRARRRHDPPRRRARHSPRRDSDDRRRLRARRRGNRDRLADARCRRRPRHSGLRLRAGARGARRATDAAERAHQGRARADARHVERGSPAPPADPDAPRRRARPHRRHADAGAPRRRAVAAPAARPAGARRPARAGRVRSRAPASRLAPRGAVMELADVRARAELVLDEVERSVVGKRDALELVLAALLADGHVLLEDYPGLAKTLIARSFAQATSLEFSRIQFTPDLMPSDVTGSSMYDQRLGAFTFLPGPIFTNLLLADEINRAPPKTQAALLEAMQERQVTSEGETRTLPPPFLVLATQNPIEYEGTYPLPEAQLDRFLVRIGVGYPARDDEIDMLQRRLDRTRDEVELRPVVDRETLLAMQRALEQVHVAPAIEGYIVDLVSATRASRRLAVGASPRGSLALLKL